MTLWLYFTHAVVGLLGGNLSGFFANPSLLFMMYPDTTYHYISFVKLFHSLTNGELWDGLKQMLCQVEGTAFVAGWNVMTSLICILISRFIDLRLPEDNLEIGDDAVHGEEAYALWGDGERMPNLYRRLHRRLPSWCRTSITENLKLIEASMP